MNIYETKVIVCAVCKNPIGEIEWDALVIHPLCGQCTNPLPEGDTIQYVASYYQNKFLAKVSRVG